MTQKQPYTRFLCASQTKGAPDLAAYAPSVKRKTHYSLARAVLCPESGHSGGLKRSPMMPELSLSDSRHAAARAAFRWSKLNHAAAHAAELRLLDRRLEVPPGTCRLVWEDCLIERDKGEARPFEAFLETLADVYELAVSKVREILDALCRRGRDIAEAVRDILRQGEALARRMRENAAGSVRKRLWRQRKAQDRRQTELLLPILGRRGIGEAPPPLREEREKEESIKEEDDSEARSARLVVASAPASPTPEEAARLKARKRDLLVQKLWRFVNATMHGETAAAAYAGLLADNPREAQRWLDKLDLEMRSRGWRDASPSLTAWE
jgi:hypothetical protein